jgi:TAP-like protein
VKADDFKDSCAPLMPVVHPQTLTYSGAAPIVVVGGTNDPATPFRWAEEMAADMGDTARLVTFTGEGHGFVLASTCVTQIEAAVLVDLQVPDKDTVCDPDPDVAKPLWWDSLPVPTGIGDAVGSPEVAAFLGLSPSVAYSETRSASLSQADVITGYDTAMEGVGFTIAGHQQPIDGIDQAVYLSPTGEVFSVLAIGPDSFALPALAGLDQLVDTTTTLVVLLHLPQ